MKYLFLVISFLYSFIFYLFYLYSNWKNFYFFEFLNNNQINHYSLRDPIIYSVDFKEHPYIQSIFWNLIIETVFFILVWIMFFLYFSPSVKKEEKKVSIKNELLIKYSQINFKEIFMKFLNKFSYYIGFILFYISLYFVSLWLEIKFLNFILILNILVILWFFLSKFNDFARIFLRINSIIFSFLYIFLYLYIFFTNNNFFSIVELFNSILIIFSFLILLYFNKKNILKNKYDNIILTHFIIYLFFVFLFYTNYYLFESDLFFSLIIQSSIFWVLLFEFLPKNKYLINNKLILKYIWILFSYLSTVLSFIFILIDFNKIVFLLLIFYIFYNYYIHFKYVNYISFFLFIFGLYFIIVYSLNYFFGILYNTLIFLIFSIAFSYFLILFTYLKNFKILFDIYFLHFFSYFINIISILVFIFTNFSNLTFTYIGFLLFFESLYFFISYNRLYNNDLKLWRKQ